MGSCRQGCWRWKVQQHCAGGFPAAGRGHADFEMFITLPSSGKLFRGQQKTARPSLPQKLPLAKFQGSEVPSGQELLWLLVAKSMFSLTLLWETAEPF